MSELDLQLSMSYTIASKNSKSKQVNLLLPNLLSNIKNKSLFYKNYT